MATFGTNDTVFATARSRVIGTVNVRLVGLNSVKEIVSAVKSEIGTFSGILNITMRNVSQGWFEEKSIYVM